MAWKRRVKTGASLSDPSLSMYAGKLSGPGAVKRLMFERGLRTPSQPISNSGTVGWGLVPRDGSVAVSSLVITNVNWSFKTFAFDSLSLCRMPFFIEGATPELSHRLLLMKDQNFLGFTFRRRSC